VGCRKLLGLVLEIRFALTEDEYTICVFGEGDRSGPKEGIYVGRELIRQGLDG